MCEKSLATNYSLKNHMESFHASQNFSSHECLECQKTFRKKSQLQLHTKKVHLKTIPKNVCKLCSKPIRHMKKHMESKHQEIENKDSLLYPKEIHKCTECDKTFSTKYRRHD